MAGPIRHAPRLSVVAIALAASILSAGGRDAEGVLESAQPPGRDEPRQNVPDPPRPTQDPRFRYHPVPDPAYYGPPRPVSLRFLAPEDCSFTLFGPGGQETPPLGHEARANARSRARYLFALTVGVGARAEKFYGSFDVLRGPMVPPDVNPFDAAVPIVFDEEDLLQILRERMITKFLVLENPETSLDFPSDPNLPIRYDATFDPDVVKRAKELGKILVVVRIGTRIPSREEMIGVSGSHLFIAKKIEVVDAGGSIHKLNDQWIKVESYPNGPIEQVGHSSHDGAPRAPFPISEDCPSGTCPPSASRPPGVDFRSLLNNDLTNNFEYLCDGGDRRPRVGWVESGRVVNIDPEDTIAEYRPQTGGNRIAISNRVCLFSPRFVEVRVLQGSEGYDAAVNSGAVARDAGPIVALGQHPQLEKKGYTSAGQLIDRRILRGLLGAQWPGDLVEIRSLAGYKHTQGWAVIVGLFGWHHVTGSEQPEIKARVQFVDDVTLDLMPQIVGMVAGTGEVYSIWTTKEIREVEIQPECPDVLVLEKASDRASAKVGEEVLFAIRYTNTGSQPISNIAVTDSLISRFEYVEETADSDRPATFLATENEAGSMTLRWEIKEPLPAGESGHLSFKVRVR